MRWRSRPILFSLPAVHAPTPPDTLAFPFNQRWLMALWSTLLQCRSRAFSPTRRKARNGTAAPIWPKRWPTAASATRRAISLQALDNRQQVRRRGGRRLARLQHHPATGRPASAAGATTTWRHYLARAMPKDTARPPDPMGEAVDNSLMQLTPGDISALVAYLRTIPAMADPALPAPKTAPASAAPNAVGGRARQEDFRGRLRQLP